MSDDHKLAASYQRGEKTVEKSFNCPHGANLLSCALSQQVQLDHICRVGICGTCQVIVTSGAENLSAPTPEELELLTTDVIAEGVRLACQTRVEGAAELNQ